MEYLSINLLLPVMVSVNAPAFNAIIIAISMSKNLPDRYFVFIVVRSFSCQIKVILSQR